MFDSTQIINKVTYNGTSISFPSYNASAPLLDMILDNTITSLSELTLSGIRYLTGESFISVQTNLMTLNLPDCEYLNTYAISDMIYLSSISAPKLKYITNAFKNISVQIFPNVTQISLPFTGFQFGVGAKVIDLPKIKSLITGTYGFSNVALQSLYLSALEFISVSVSSRPVFYTLNSLTTLELPKLKSYYGDAPLVSSCQNITSLNLPNLTITKNLSSQFNGIIRDCPNLQTISLPNLQSVGAGTTFSNIGVTELNLPQLISIPNQVLFIQNCPNLVSINCPNLVNVYAPNFATGCPNLETINFGSQIEVVSTTISAPKLGKLVFPSTLYQLAGNFSNCTSLSQIILNGLTTLNANMFTNTPLSNSTYLGYYGSIYVPSEYVDTYKAMTNWSLYSDRITSLENLGG